MTINNDKNFINENIRFQNVLLIDENGQKVGIVNTKTALYKAKDADLDLVCINAKSTPPVCKILNYNKFKYEQKQKEKESKKKQVKIENKEIQLRPNIGIHDLNVKIKKAREELLKGNRINIVLSFRGRELAHTDIGFNTINKFISELGDISTAFKQPAFENKKIFATLVKKKELK